MYNPNIDGELRSALQKSIRWCEVNASRYFAQQLMQRGKPGSVFNRLMIIAAEDVGLADPTLIVYVRQCLDSFENLIKQSKIKKRDAFKYPRLCEIVDRAVIAAAISYKIRLLPFALFVTLFDIYQNEDFSKNVYEYLDRFVVAINNRDEKQALYYAYVIDIFLNSKNQVLTVIQNQNGTRNRNLIQAWVDEYKKKDELLFLAGSIALLCRDLNFNHGEYNGAISRYFSLPISPAEIPDRAYDMHTLKGEREKRGLVHFFNYAATIKNERPSLSNDWENEGKNAYLQADEEKLGRAKKVIKAIKENYQVTNIRPPFHHKKAVLTQARSSRNRPYAFIVEFNDGSRKFIKGPFKNAALAEGHLICNELKRRLSSKYLHPVQCQLKEHGTNQMFFECEEIGRADLSKITLKYTKLNGYILVLDYESNDVVPDPLASLEKVNNDNCGIWIELMVNYCFRWIFGIGDTARRNLMLQKSTGKIYSVDETGIENVSHEIIWGRKKPKKEKFELVKTFMVTQHFNEVLSEVNRWRKFLYDIRRELIPLSKNVEQRMDKLLKYPRIAFDF